jgi:hypothetical protein
LEPTAGEMRPLWHLELRVCRRMEVSVGPTVTQRARSVTQREGGGSAGVRTSGSSPCPRITSLRMDLGAVYEASFLRTPSPLPV